MSSNEKHEQVLRTARGLGREIRRQVHDGWKGVRVATRNEPGRHVWRFQRVGGESARYLHIQHRDLAAGGDAPERLLQQLSTGRWLDRLREGGDNASLRLALDGRLVAQPRP